MAEQPDVPSALCAHTCALQGATEILIGARKSTSLTTGGW